MGKCINSKIEKLFFGAKEAMPGLFLVILVSLLAYASSRVISGLGELTLAILFGVMSSAFFPLRPSTRKGEHLAEGYFLSLAVILMGFGFDADVLLEIGSEAFIIAGVLVSGTILIHLILGAIIKTPFEINLLIGLGNAICGTSAIAAASSLISRNNSGTGIAISIINILGTVGVFILICICKKCDLSSDQAGFMVGGSLQAVGHVAAAGYALGDAVGQMSMVIKMVRMLLLLPALVLIAWYAGLPRSRPGTIRLIRELPVYLKGFALTAMASNLVDFPDWCLSLIKNLSHGLLLLAMSAIGLGIRLSVFKTHGLKALMLGAMGFTLQLVMLLLLIKIVN